ncbi:hypothetical protein TorRG33x02_315590 [Trema orientale]|uniref:DUF1985 domain-containing protein n=1 Tax=Trema orientale TaxID=63057 RepID=A0A2P5BMX0_TREOI|nr:hypothetical protein TorRG33x02_315590 [Trema orientale]
MSPEKKNQKSKLLVPFEEHFPGRVTIKGTTMMSKIKERFEKYDLLEKAKQCSFKQFFLTPPMQASGVLIHQLLLRKVKSKNPAELQFFTWDSNLRFRLGEFALIMALNFGKDPDVVKYKSMTCSMRLRETYLNNEANVRSGELEAAFLNCEEKEDIWKLGLCYLVDGLLMAHESSTKILMDMLSFVENEEDFFNYPWGRRSYERTSVYALDYLKSLVLSLES